MCARQGRGTRLARGPEVRGRSPRKPTTSSSRRPGVSIGFPPPSSCRESPKPPMNLAHFIFKGKAYGSPKCRVIVFGEKDPLNLTQLTQEENVPADTWHFKYHPISLPTNVNSIGYSLES